MAKVLSEAANCSLSKGTWQNYATAVKHIKKMNTEWGTRVRFPFTEDMVYNYVGYLLHRGMKPQTVRSYLAAIRHRHRELGYCGDSMNPVLLDAVLNGERNWNNQQRLARERMPITRCMLLELKHWIRLNVKMSVDKARLWTICTWLWWGSFRGRELLGESSSTFNAEDTLLGCDVTMKTLMVDKEKVRMVIVTLKTAKETRGKATEVELLENGGQTCPVAAFLAWMKLLKKRPERELPLFRKESGKIVTTEDMNKILKSVFAESITASKFVSVHSFRSGMASEMARSGYGDEEIQIQGRWSSESYLKYIKLGRAQKIGSQLKLSKTLSC